MTQEVSIDQLSEAFEAVRRVCPGLPVLAIRWMHLKHPLHERQEMLLSQAGLSEEQTVVHHTTWRLLRTALRSALYAVYLSSRLVWLQMWWWRQLAAQRREPFDVIAKTCCFGSHQPTSERDFYYGDLQQRLATRRVRMLLLCGDVTGGDWLTFARRHTTPPPSARVPELCLVPPFAPLALLIQQLLTCLRLRRMTARGQDPLIRRISQLASHDCLVPNTTLAALGFWMGKRAVEIWHPRAFLTLYEGHASEQCLRWGVKAAGTGCQSVGYQHTIIFPESRALTTPPRDLQERSWPDVILGLGSVPLELMRASHERYGVRLIRFGSFRSQASHVMEPADPARRTILVTPEGIRDEIQSLFTFAYHCAQRMPHDTFVLRCHPEIPMRQALQLVSVDLSHQPNVVLSDHARIEEDFSRSSILLYRGSSAVVYAILYGLRPIYLHVPARRDRDPLYALDGWRERCATPEEFSHLLAGDHALPGPQRAREWHRASQYVNAYTGPVDEERIGALLQTVGFNGTSH